MAAAINGFKIPHFLQIDPLKAIAESKNTAPPIRDCKRESPNQDTPTTTAAAPLPKPSTNSSGYILKKK